MAGDWMKVEKVTPDKPEIDGMAAVLGIDPDAVFGKCFRIWRWFDDHTLDGNAPSVTKALLDRRVGVTGFADAMESAGWLVATNGGVSLPHFDRHNGETSKGRALTAKRVAAHKAKCNAISNGAVTQPLTVDALPREEKRRVNTPLPPRRGDRVETGKRKRGAFHPITFASMHDWIALMAWVKAHGERFNREPGGDVEKIQEAALTCSTPDEFLASVHAGIGGNWGEFVGISRDEFKRRAALNGGAK